MSLAEGFNLPVGRSSSAKRPFLSLAALVLLSSFSGASVGGGMFIGFAYLLDYPIAGL